MKYLLKKIYAKLFFKQFTIGIMKEDIRQIILNKKKDYSVKWLPLENYKDSVADPFLFVDENGEVNILAEIFSSGEYDGKIGLIKYDEKKGFSSPEIVLDEGKHLSYPCIHRDAGKMYVLQTELDGPVFIYEYDKEKKKLRNKTKICDTPLIDATILEKNNKYWLFGTIVENGKSDNLYIYYADNLAGPYKPHLNNPVKNTANGSRSAGNFIKLDGEIYRPTQNCEKYYGESITINKVIKLNEREYEYKEHMVIKANEKDEFNFGVHTINVSGKYIIIDAQKGHFQPVMQIVRAFKRMFNRIETKAATLVYFIHDNNIDEIAKGA
ncbi:MAG: hypothetical protein WBP16_01060 [Ferruginibacter sp.]